MMEPFRPGGESTSMHRVPQKHQMPFFGGTSIGARHRGARFAAFPDAARRGGGDDADARLGNYGVVCSTALTRQAVIPTRAPRPFSVTRAASIMGATRFARRRSCRSSPHPLTSAGARRSPPCRRRHTRGAPAAPGLRERKLQTGVRRAGPYRTWRQCCSPDKQARFPRPHGLRRNLSGAENRRPQVRRLAHWRTKSAGDSVVRIIL
jgi:hypothetical protein